MISGWVLAIVVLFVMLFGVVIVLQMRANTQLEIIVRAIPLGTPRIQERRPAAAPVEEQRTRPVGATPRHGNGG